ncbi:MAG: metallophosphoesterase [Bacillaceae bacterium]|nr:metallophosphoesterase [Bacillaceae bacterium]
MSLLVMSDTHGMTEEVRKLVEKVTSRKKFDHLIHCGDFVCDRSQDPFRRMVQVRGNCDFDDSVPEEQIVEWDDLRVLVVHGHRLNVKRTAMNLQYRAEETNADIVLFGHTHVMTSGVNRGKLFVNPGSLAQPRKYSTPSFAILDRVREKGERVQIKVRFFTPELRQIKSQGGVYMLRENP